MRKFMKITHCNKCYSFVLVALCLICLGCSSQPSEQPKSMTELISMLRDPGPDVQLQAIAYLRPMGAEAREAVPDLIRLLGSPNLQVRLGATSVIGLIGPDAKGAVPVLADMLDGNDPELAPLRRIA